MDRKTELRSGYTTGTCAAAAAKAAAELLLLGKRGRKVDVGLPGGPRVTLGVKSKRLRDGLATASVIKDAGDDPDVTNGAEISSTVSIAGRRGGVRVKGGKGVGVVTRPGLPVKPGRPAINPVPMKMIRAAVREVLRAHGSGAAIDVVISVPRGEELSKKTLNPRLGIIGGISILGTTGIVRPFSCDAWVETIKSSLAVAKAAGVETVVFSCGRTSERAHMKAFGFAPQAYVMSGDHIGRSLQEARRIGVRRLHVAAQWAKLLKIAMGSPDTHVRAGAFDTDAAAVYLRGLGVELPHKRYNTAREMFDNLKDPASAARAVCAEAARYAAGLSGADASAVLVTYDGKAMGAEGE